jgi:hypothetical protein
MAESTVMTTDEIVALIKSMREQLVHLEKAVKTAMKARPTKKVADPDAPKRPAGAWALWAKEMPELHPAEFAKFKATKEAELEEGKKARGLHILFAKAWRDEHEDEWKAFEARHQSEAPVSACASAPAPEPARAPTTPVKKTPTPAVEAPSAPKKVPKKKVAGGAGAPSE